MLHMLPSSLNVSTRWNYPWAFFMSALGFLVVWGIDHVHVVAMDDDECESHCKNYHKHSDSMEYGTSHEDHLKKPISHERSHSMGHSHDLGHLQKYLISLFFSLSFSHSMGCRKNSVNELSFINSFFMVKYRGNNCFVFSLVTIKVTSHQQLDTLSVFPSFPLYHY